MSSDKNDKNKDGQRRERRISIRSVRRDEPDTRKLARALIAIVQAQAEAEAQAQHAHKKEQGSREVA
jgi:hypothetical protein